MFVLHLHFRLVYCVTVPSHIVYGIYHTGRLRSSVVKEEKPPVVIY